MKKLLFFLLFVTGFIVPCLCKAQSYVWIITTFAGNGLGTYSGDSGQAKLAGLINPSGVAADRNGNVYITDQNNNRVRKVNAAGVITTIAGTGSFGYTGDGGRGDTATLSAPTGVSVDKQGNVYIADHNNNVIRKVDTNGIITTFAGDGVLGFGGDGGPATSDSAMLYAPADVGVDTIGNVYIIDQDNNRVRKVDTSGIITTIAGTGTAGYGGDGGPATAAELNFPNGGGQVDKYGNVYIADFYNSRVRSVSPAGYITTVAGNGTGGYSGDDSLAINAELYDASAVGLDDSGNIYISDYYNNRIRKVTVATGIITTIAGNGTGGYSGDDSLATLGEIFHPQGVAVDSSGNVFIADYDNHVVREVTKKYTTTAVNTPADLPTFKIFPNPSQGRFTIQISNDKMPTEAIIYDAIGEKVYQSNLDYLLNSINLSGQPDGIYILYLKSDGNNTVQKLILAH